MRSKISRWFRPVCLALTVAHVVGFLALICIHPGNRELFFALFAVFHITPHLFAGICCIVYAIRGQHAVKQYRIAWLLIGLSCFSYLAGDFVFASYESAGAGKVPCPSWADAGWLCVFPFLIGGVLLLLRSIPHSGRIRMLLDSAIVTSSVGVVIWYFLMQQLWQRSGIAYAGKLASISYPTGDIASLFCATLLLKNRSAHNSTRRSSALLAAGIICWSFSDTLYTYDRFLGRYAMGSWYDWGWPFGALLIAYACLIPMWNKNGQEDLSHVSLDTQATQARNPFRLLAPYFAVSISLLFVVGSDFANGNGIASSTFCVALGMLVLVLVRQVFTLFENRYLTSQLSTQLTYNQELTEELTAMNEELNASNGELGTLNTYLEDRVEQRTKQLGVLLELTQAVNTTLDVEDVLSAALRYTKQAFQADASLIWLCESAGGESDEIQLPYCEGLENDQDARRFLSCQPLSNQMELLPLPIFSPTNPIDEGAAGCLRAPIIWKQKLLGMIGVVAWQMQLEPTDWGLMQSIGLEIGTALANAREHQIALDAADKDPVTGLYNHRAIHQALMREMAQEEQVHERIAVLMLDLNNFKMFNDTYGHPAGDAVLKEVACALSDACAGLGYAGRYGGDEFMLILPSATQEEAVHIAERLRERMINQGYRRVGEDRIIPIELSFGIALFPEDGVNHHELITVADANLYTAKRSENGIQSSTEMQRSNRELRSLGTFDVLDAMVTAIDNKDSYTRVHSEDVTEYSLWTAEELGASEETLRLVRMSGLLHDVGKIGVPDEILRKPGRLTPEEYEVMKRHPRLGALIVSAVMDSDDIVDGVRSHHERWDGQGYPDGTSGEETPFLGRLLAVADAFSAMTTDRPYRKGLDWDFAFKEIEANVGTQFDPAIAKAFLKAARKRRPQTMAEPTPSGLPGANIPEQKVA